MLAMSRVANIISPFKVAPERSLRGLPLSGSPDSGRSLGLVGLVVAGAVVGALASRNRVLGALIGAGAGSVIAVGFSLGSDIFNPPAQAVDNLRTPVEF